MLTANVSIFSLSPEFEPSRPISLTLLAQISW